MHRVFAALLITILSFGVLLGPVAWLGLSLTETARSLAERIGAGDIAVPPPPAAVKHWPLIGDRLSNLWSLASTNLKAALLQMAPHLRPMRSTLLAFVGSTGVGMLKFIVAMAICGFLLGVRTIHGGFRQNDVSANGGKSG